MSYEVRQGDCREVLPTIAEALIDACVTDPPYGLEFMGKGWDGSVPPPDLWTAVARTLKPGAYLLAFGGTRTWHRLACAIEDGGFKLQDSLMWLHGQGFPKGKTQLKPAWEPILLAYKPGPRTLNVDACRLDVGTLVPGGGRSARGNGGCYGDGVAPENAKAHSSGRWPANLLLDEEAARMLDEQSGAVGGGSTFTAVQRERNKGWANSSPGPGVVAIDNYGDSGGASRFFYTAKADSGQRHYAGRNTHPTVKPVALMRWLCRLITPKDGLVLDPFTGSGSTGVAALSEGFRFLGIEREAAYVELARKRIAGPLFAGATA